jgi:hypothetical protein
MMTVHAASSRSHLLDRRGGAPAVKPFLLLPAAALLALCPAAAPARTVDSDDNSVFLEDGRLFRFDYANDFFAGRDRYYTQGYGFDLFHPSLSKSPLMRLLFALPGRSGYGLSFRQSGFTPTSLFSDAPLRGDRPFASYIFIGHLRVSRDEERGVTLTTEIDAGLIGQGAGGEWIQTGLHRVFGNLLPMGWDNQIRNEPGFVGEVARTLASVRNLDTGEIAATTTTNFRRFFRL